MKRVGYCCTVLLLGVIAMAAGRSARPAKTGKAIQAGTWGGLHVRMEVTPSGARLEFDCARGKLLEPIVADDKGQFQARGTFTPEHGGAVRRDERSSSVEVVYKGVVSGETMKIETALPGDGGTVGPFRLTRGQAGQLMKCR